MGASTSRMTVSDIAELAGVQRATVSNWQRRHDEFPKPLPDSPPGRPQFDAAAVRNWLAVRYPERSMGDGRAAETVRAWRYMVNHVQCDDPTDPLILLIAAIQGEPIHYSGASSDERYPMCVSVDDLDTRIFATKSQAEAIRQFLENEIIVVDKAELLEAAAEELDDIKRWRRSPEAVAAEQNLRNLLAELVHEESEKVLDFACGTGALLLATSRKYPNATFVGMEPDFIDAFVADARLWSQAHVELEDHNILEVDALAGRTFSAVVSIPPFGVKVDATTNERLRRLPFGPVRGAADAAWPQLAVQALAPDGEAFLVLPHALTFDDRADHIRRELIRQGVLAAVVTLPANAHPSRKGLSDLWVLTRRRKRTADVLMVDYSAVEPDDEDAYETLRHELSAWLDFGGPAIIPDEEDGAPHLRFVGVDARYVDVDPIELLGPTVVFDPQYWCARAATPTSADELISVVDEKANALSAARVAMTAAETPDCHLSPDRLTMITVRDARESELLEIVRRIGASKEQPTLTPGVAEAMRRGDYTASTLR